MQPLIKFLTFILLLNCLPFPQTFAQPGALPVESSPSPLPDATAPGQLPPAQMPTSFTNRQEELRRRLAARTNALSTNQSSVPIVLAGTNTGAPRTFMRDTNRVSSPLANRPGTIPLPTSSSTTPTVSTLPGGQSVITTSSGAVITSTNANATVVTPAPGTSVIVNPNPFAAATNSLRNVAGQSGAPGSVSLPSVGMNPPITLAQPPGSPTVITNEDTSLANLPISSNPVNPAVDANERYEPGDLQLNEMPLPQFFELYSLYSGRTILRPSALPAPNLNLRAQTPLTRREVVEAMDAVLALNLITMIPIGDKFVKAVPSAQAVQEGAPLSEIPAAQLPITEQFITRIVKLKVAKAAEIAPILQSFAKTPNGVTPIENNNTLVLRDYSSNIKRMLEIIETLDVQHETDFSLEVIPIKYGKVGDIYATMSALISGGGGGAGGTTGTTAGAAGRIGSSMGMGGRMGGMRGGGMGGFGNSAYGGGGYGGGGYGGSSSYNRYGGGGYYPQEQELNRLTEMTPQQVAPGSAGGAQSNFNRRLNDIVSRASTPPEMRILEGANIVPDERSNKLLIFANKRDMAMITNIVSKVDVLLAQVLIEAVILEVNLRDSLTFGVSAAQSPKRFGQDFSGAGNINNGQALLGNLTNFPGGTPGGFNYFGHIGNDFDVAVNAIAEDRQFDVLSKPRIQTSHAIPGFFFIGSTVPYVTGFTDYGGYVGGGLSTRSQVTERTIGLNLGVTPFITPEGMVVMEIEQSFENRQGTEIIEGNPYPLVNSRQASAVLTVRNGDLIMLGGFISENKGSTKRGVPFLKDIPGLGALFRSTIKENDRTELIILMKATVLETPEAAAFLANTERSQLPGIYQAEKSFQESEAKRLKKAKKK